MGLGPYILKYAMNFKIVKESKKQKNSVKKDWLIPK